MSRSRRRRRRREALTGKNGIFLFELRFDFGCLHVALARHIVVDLLNILSRERGLADAIVYNVFER